MTIYRQWIPSSDLRLRRHVFHDDRSYDYRFDTAGLVIASVDHARRVPVFDQGNVGSCTGNAGIGCLGTDPYYATLRGDVSKQLGAGTTGVYSLDEAGAVALYSAAEVIDGDGPYPPNDNGSSGLSVAKALKTAGQISGYQHAFSLSDTLKALSVTCLITGINWYQGMFDPSPEGIVTISGSIAGGHEIVVDSYDATRDLVGFTNSWGFGWGVSGRFFMSSATYGRLLSERGDVTIFTPLTTPAPAPVPTPPPPASADETFAAVLRPWVQHHHIGTNAAVQHAAQAWLTAKGL